MPPDALPPEAIAHPLDEPQHKPGQRALVLGGGGMFGAYQAGVWKELEPHWQPDLVVGASAGALNAFAIAAGVSGEELIALWRNLPNVGVRRVWNYRHLRSHLEQLTQRPLRRQLAVAVLPVPFLAERLYWNDSVKARHLLASCAVPLLLPPQKLDGTWCIDGAIKRVCPLWVIKQHNRKAATPLAAIGVNVWPFARYERHGTIPMIQPPEPLRPIHHAVMFHPETIDNWIQQGRAQARAFLAEPETQRFLAQH